MTIVTTCKRCGVSAVGIIRQCPECGGEDLTSETRGVIAYLRREEGTERSKFGETIRAAAEREMHFISANREQLLRAWFVETQLLPSQSVLVEQRCPDGVRVWVEKRERSTSGAGLESQ